MVFLNTKASILIGGNPPIFFVLLTFTNLYSLYIYSLRQLYLYCFIFIALLIILYKLFSIVFSIILIIYYLLFEK